MSRIRYNRGSYESTLTAALKIARASGIVCYVIPTSGGLLIVKEVGFPTEQYTEARPDGEAWFYPGPLAEAIDGAQPHKVATLTA